MTKALFILLTVIAYPIAFIVLTVMFFRAGRRKAA